MFSIARKALILFAALIGILMPGLVLGGCQRIDTAERALVAYFDATGIEYLAYVESDPLLTDQQKAIRRSSVSAAADYAADIRRRQSPIFDAGTPPSK